MAASAAVDRRDVAPARRRGTAAIGFAGARHRGAPPTGGAAAGAASPGPRLRGRRPAGSWGCPGTAAARTRSTIRTGRDMPPSSASAAVGGRAELVAASHAARAVGPHRAPSRQSTAGQIDAPAGSGRPAPGRRRSPCRSRSMTTRVRVPLLAKPQAGRPPATVPAAAAAGAASSQRRELPATSMRQDDAGRLGSRRCQLHRPLAHARVAEITRLWVTGTGSIVARVMIRVSARIRSRPTG